MLPRLDAIGIEMMGVGEQERIMYLPVMQMLESMGLPMLNGLLSMPLNEPDQGAQMENAKELLGNLPEGITHFVLHPSIDTPELRAIASDWESRVANYRVFMSDALKTFLQQEDIKSIGYRQIRTAMRNG
jgi:hypothetical protein